MRQKRSFILLIVFPIAAMLVVGGLLFADQAMTDQQENDDVQRALAAALQTSSNIELQHLQSVNYGYGVCGLYKASFAGKGFKPFFYDMVNDHLILDINSRRYQSNCGLSSIC
ncbi:hypothetical protein [Halomonas sp. SpR8]|uniref:hypothetical protein n=1 Tax=Halomonas sp. SpR8 TaxID=3050463 RepID=UPI0027E52629|nr:hypothetical protein [Halomonas sp. SpR8]MDQ7729518.1 hypothetical protein [Halomonas sp. SpR8]